MSESTASMPQPRASEGTGRSGVLSLAIKEKAALYSAYMPFLQGGGLFIPTNKTYRMGEEVFMLLSLPEHPEKIRVIGHVAWINPVTQGNRPQGIGVQFSEKDGGTVARNSIEAILGGALKSGRPTHTM